MKVRAFVSLAFLSLIAPFGAAGALTPPAPPQPTANPAEPRIPITALPVTIEVSGSYYLTGNLTIPGAGNGIVVNASHVTIDLGGFTLAGVAPAVGDGIRANPAGMFSNVTVRNGTVRDWGGTGVNLGSVAHATVENIQALGCEDIGIWTDLHGRVMRCTVDDCGSVGIQVHGASIVEGCIASNNATQGIFATNTAVVQSCMAFSNDDDGIAATGTILDCVVEDNGTGISAGSNTVISRCTAEGNMVGISESGRSLITECTVTDSVATGIDLGNGSSVRNCNVTSINAIAVVNGINVADSCRVENNHLRGHVNGNGILVAGDNNRIEGNDNSGGNIGILVNGDNNLVIRNSGADNNAHISNTGANNVVGPTATVGTIGGSTPHANFLH